MPHTFTSPERTAVQGSSLDQYAKLEIQDPDLNWVNVSTGLGSFDWFNSAQIADTVDNSSLTFSASLLRDSASLSLCPLRTDSTLNRDSTTTYAPFLDLVRMWRVSVAVMPDGDSPVYKEIAKGYIDSIDVDDVSPTITVTGRGEEAQLLDCEILELRTYSVGTTATMAEVIQSLLDDNLFNPPTLYEPVPITFVINEYEQQYGNLMQAINAVAALVGAVVRYRYDSAGVNRLTLFLPDRSAAPGDEDWTIASTEYLRLPVNRSDISGVRNYVTVRYNDSDTAAVETVKSPTGGTSASIIRYRELRSLPIDLAEDTQILTASDAQALADAIRSDLEWPYLQQRFVTYGFWFVQICDYGKLTANGVHYNDDQYGGVTGFTHEITNGVIRTSVDLGGPPIGGYKKWITMARTRRALRPPSDGPISDPVLPPFIPPDVPGEPALYVTGTGRTALVGLGLGNGAHVSDTASGTSSGGGSCIPALSGHALSADYAMGLCDVSTTNDVYALSDQLAEPNGHSGKDSPTQAGTRMTYAYGIQLVDDVSSANGARHLETYDPGSTDHGLSDVASGGYADVYHNLKILFPADLHTNFWARALIKNPSSNAVGFLNLSAQGGGGINIIYDYGLRGRVNIGPDGTNGSDGFASLSSVPPLTGVVTSTDLLDVMFHFVLTNATSMPVSNNIRYDVAVDVYLLLNNASLYHASTSCRVQQNRFGGLLANPLAPFNMAMTTGLDFDGMEIHGWEFSTDSDPFGVVAGPFVGADGPAPSNDNFANRDVISGSSGSTNVDTAGATTEVGEPLQSGNVGKTVWLEWTSPFNGSVSFDTFATTQVADTTLGVFTGTAVGSLTQIAYNDDFSGHGGLSKVTFTAVLGTVYKIQIGTFGGQDWGIVTLTWA